MDAGCMNFTGILKFRMKLLLSNDIQIVMLQNNK